MNATQVKFKRCVTLKDCQNDPRLSVGVCYESDDGSDTGGFYSCCLKAGYRTIDNDQHIIYAASVKELCSEINNARLWEDDPELSMS